MKSKRTYRQPWGREERLLTLEELVWLNSPEGRSVCAEMASGKPADTPSAISHWRERLPPAQVAAAWKQVTLRKAARAKFSKADDMFFDRVGLEQATDEVVAAHKACRFAGFSKVADLCCGIGGDAIALAAGRELIAVDYSSTRVALAEHNAAVYNHKITGVVDDVAFIRPDAEAVHIDPDRREEGKRSHQPQLSSPELGVVEQIVRHYEAAAIKLSPGADFDTLPFDSEIELISHNGECKQAVAWTGRLKQVHRRATVLPSGESICASIDDNLAWQSPESVKAGCFLFEPDPAVIRANLVGVVAAKYDLSPIDERIAYLVGSQPVATSLVRAFRVIDVMPWSIKPTRQWLNRHDIGRVDIKTRGFAAKPEEILHRLRLTGQKHAILFLTRVGEKPLAILAERWVE